MATKLGELLKIATKEEREELARRAGTSVGYLRLLGYGYRENPKIRLAIKLRDAANDIYHRGGGMLNQYITLEDIAAATRRGVE